MTSQSPMPAASTPAGPTVRGFGERDRIDFSVLFKRLMVVKVNLETWAF